MCGCRVRRHKCLLYPKQTTHFLSASPPLYMYIQRESRHTQTTLAFTTPTMRRSWSSSSSSTSPRSRSRSSSKRTSNTATDLDLGLSMFTTTDTDNDASLFVKVYMEGHPIGRKLDILAHHCYQQLIATLDHMFQANILWGEEAEAENCNEFHVLTYEDEEGDWLMVGDVPWEMFLSTVKRLKITRACPC